MVLSRTCCGPESPVGGACPCTDPVSDPGAVPPDRNRYFTGKYLTARDLTSEQGYFVSRHRLHQRALHGWGVVVGLDVVPHPTPDCANEGWVVITPGIAVDCYGREVIVRAPVPLLLPAVFPDTVRCGEEEWDKDRGDYFPKDPPQANQSYLLVIRYAETCVESVPVFADADGCTPRKASNRVSEGVCFRFMAFPEKNPPACWGTPRPPKCPCPPPPDPSKVEIPESLDKILAQTCDAECAGAVPLALVKFGKTTVQSEVIVDGRRYLPGPLNPRQLTHICDISWDHDGKTPAAQIWNDYRDAHNQQNKGHDHKEGIRLTVTFDRPLHECMTEAVRHSGRRFFSVRFKNADGILQSAANQVVVTLSDCQTRLHYDIEKCHLHDAMHAHPVVYVTLNCDFLTDKWGRAVDGNHLHGLLPTGDGVEGGTFESWFRLTEGTK